MKRYENVMFTGRGRFLSWPLALLISLTFCLLTETHADAKKKHKMKYLSLYVGVPHDERIDVPSLYAIKAKGTFRPLTAVHLYRKDSFIRLEPKKQGVGTLILYDPATAKIFYEYRIDVKKTNISKMAREVRSFLQDIEGIQIRIINNMVVVDGEILVPRDMKRIHNVVKQYGGRATSLVVLSTIAEKKIAQFIERDINNPEIQVRVINKKFILEGFVNAGPDGEKERQRAEIIAQSYITDMIVDEAVSDRKVRSVKSEIVINLIKTRAAPTPPPGKMIQLVFHYVELSKDYTKGFRFQWTPDLGDGSQVSFTSGGKTPGGFLSTLTGTISNLLPKLNWAKEHGHARILKSTSIIVQDKERGALNSTTQVPYQVVSAQGVPSTSFATAGLKTNVTPSIMGSSNSIRMIISFEASSFIGGWSGKPMINSKSFNTTLVVRSGQSAAVAGLITNETATGYNKLPKNVSRNPLFSLYTSKDFRRSQSQFVVFITPIIKSSSSMGAEKIKRRFHMKK